MVWGVGAAGVPKMCETMWGLMGKNGLWSALYALVSIHGLHGFDLFVHFTICAIWIQMD